MQSAYSVVADQVQARQLVRDAKGGRVCFGEITMNNTRKAIEPASIVEYIHRFDRFVMKAVKHIYGAHIERAQMRLAPIKNNSTSNR